MTRSIIESLKNLAHLYTLSTGQRVQALSGKEVSCSRHEYQMSLPFNDNYKLTEGNQKFFTALLESCGLKNRGQNIGQIDFSLADGANKDEVAKKLESAVASYSKKHAAESTLEACTQVTDRTFLKQQLLSAFVALNSTNGKITTPIEARNIINSIKALNSGEQSHHKKITSSDFDLLLVALRQSEKGVFSAPKAAASKVVIRILENFSLELSGKCAAK